MATMSVTTVTVASRGRYRYTELKPGQTRLLELLPGSGELKAKIHVITIPGCEEIVSRSSNATTTRPRSRTPIYNYNALSHHWEPKEASKQRSIALQHGNELFDLSIRPSLHAFLQEIRDGIKERRSWANAHYLWVDAICIDQDSDSDKTIQLPRMGAIYNGAASVIVWLGPSTVESKRAIDFITRLQTEQELSRCLTGTDSVEDWRCFAHVTRLPWFTRCWIVQEIAAAKKTVILIGKDCIEWDAFAGALSLFGKQYEEIRTMIRRGDEFVINKNWLGEIAMSGAYILVETKDNFLRKRSDGTVTEHNFTLEALLTTLSSFQVSRAHDVVYSILWLSRDANVQRKHQVLRDRSPRGADRQHWAHQLESKGERRLSENARIDRLSEHTGTGRLSEQYLNVPAKKIEQDQIDEDQSKVNGITLNYKMSVYDLVKEVVEHVVNLTGSLDILCYPWAPLPLREVRDASGNVTRAREPPHPTWVKGIGRNIYPRQPGKRQNDVSRRCGPDPLVGRPGTGLRPYRASGQIRARDDNVKIDGRILRCTGWPIATVKEVGDPASDAVISRDWLTSLGWTDTNEPPPDVLWRLLVGNKSANHISPPPARFKLACKWLVDNTGEDENINLQLQKDDGHHEAVFKEFVDKAISTTWNRRLFFTDTCALSKPDAPDAPDANFKGLGPKEVRVGDKVCVLFGCSVPVLLRPYTPPAVTEADKSCPSSSQSANESPGGLPVPAVTVQDEQTVSVNETINDHMSSVNSAESCKKNTIEAGPTRKEAFEFVGECYVHELMDGEVFDHVAQHKTIVQDFFIY